MMFDISRFDIHGLMINTVRTSKYDKKHIPLKLFDELEHIFGKNVIKRENNGWACVFHFIDNRQMVTAKARTLLHIFDNYQYTKCPNGKKQRNRLNATVFKIGYVVDYVDNVASDVVKSAVVSSTYCKSLCNNPYAAWTNTILRWLIEKETKRKRL